MKPKLYVESSIVSYLTAEPSGDLITAARQALTQQWWNEKRFDYELYISEFVVSEVQAGDAPMAARRIDALSGIAEIGLTEAAAQLRRCWSTKARSLAGQPSMPCTSRLP